ncbi:MAG: 2-oxo acid dehydrogenase subunit E2 [Acidobacteriota bacterium]
MATNVIMPALEMAQETGKVLRWLKAEGETVGKGEPIMEIETDKVTVEIESPASGIVGGISAREGDTVPVGQTIAWVLAPGEKPPAISTPTQSGRTPTTAAAAAPPPSLAGRRSRDPQREKGGGGLGRLPASPVAVQIAREHGIDLTQVKPRGSRIEKADVLAYLQTNSANPIEKRDGGLGRTPASPKARRLAAERGIDLQMLQGSGPDGAVLVADLPTAASGFPTPPRQAVEEVSTVWRVMAERMSSSWTTVPHFYLMREIAAAGLVEMRARISNAIQKRNNVKPTYTDFLVKMAAMALRDHPRVNAAYIEGGFRFNDDINIGIATAIEEGLIVPVIHHADTASLGEIAVRRQELIERANAGRLKPADITGGTFTITNLGMYNVDAFNAIVNAPQAAILAVGRIADRVVPVDGQPAVRPMMILTLSCDHRVVDGARAARFLDDLVNLIEEPWGLLA